MKWGVHTTHAAATSSPVVTEPASPPPTLAMGKATVWMVQMRQIACASHPNPPALLSSTCAHQESALITVRCAMGRWTARTTVMKKAAVRQFGIYVALFFLFVIYEWYL